MSLIEKLQWRAAIKQFDSSKKLTAEQLTTLLDAVQLAPSSMGLQGYKVIVVEDAEIRVKLRAAAHDQAQLTDASQVIIFAAETNADDDFGKKYVSLIAKTRNLPYEALAGMEAMVLGTLNRLTPEQKINWLHKQTYIALGILLAAAADANVDATPMEGFDAAQFDEILGLKEKGLTTSVIATIGFRSEADQYSKMTKVRRPKEELFIHI